MTEITHFAADAELRGALDRHGDNVCALRTVRQLANSLGNHLNATDRVRAWSIAAICSQAAHEGDPERCVYALRAAAHAANGLAKDVGDDCHSALAYRIKDVCLSALVWSHSATVNDVDADNCIGLDILLSPPSRLHTFLEKLHSDAAAILRSQMGIAPINVSLMDRLPQAQKDALLNFPIKRRFAA